MSLLHPGVPSVLRSQSRPANPLYKHRMYATPRVQWTALKLTCCRSSSNNQLGQQQTETEATQTTVTEKRYLQQTSLPWAVALAVLSSGSSAGAKTLEVDVPDDVFDLFTNPIGTLFHSPVFAIGTAVLAMLLFPKLIRIAINYLAVPAIIAMLAWLAISYPQQTASSIYFTLEFVKDHPAASSIGIIIAAGIFLGPDLLAGTAVTGVLVLLAAQLGLVQLPRLPQLPQLPGQQVVAKHLEKAGKSFARKIEDLDGDVVDLSKRDSSGRYYYDNSSSSSSKSGGEKMMQMKKQQEQEEEERRKEQRQQQQQQQLPLPLAIPGAGRQSDNPPSSPSAVEAAAAATDASRSQPGSSSSSSSSGFAGIGDTVGSAGKGLFDKAKGALPEPEAVQAGMQKAGQGLGSAAKALKSRVQGLQEQVRGSGVVQGLSEKAGAAAAGVAARVQETVGQGPGFLKQKLQQLQQQQQQQQQQQNADVDTAAARGRLDSILSNS